MGTWTLNLAKSTYNASPAPKSGTSRLSPAAGGAMQQFQAQVLADGTLRRIETTTPFDGKDHAVASLPGVTLRADARQRHCLLLLAKQNGVVTSTTLTVVSSGGGYSDVHDGFGERGRAHRREHRGLRPPTLEGQPRAPAGGHLAARRARVGSTLSRIRNSRSAAGRYAFMRRATASTSASPRRPPPAAAAPTAARNSSM